MVILGIHCRCIQVETLVKTPEEQVSKIFKHANEQEKETMINLLGLEYWIGGHVHDRQMVFDLFQPIIQVLGHSVTTNNMVWRMIVEEIYLKVTIVLDLIDTNLSGGVCWVYFV